MAGMFGFDHHCSEEKTSINSYMKSLRDSRYSFAQIDMLWDFYVTHSLGGESGQKRELTDYGWEKSEQGTRGYVALEKALSKSAGIEKMCFIRSNTCKDTLSAMDLMNERICIEHARAVLLQNFSTTVDENERIQFSGGGENRITCLFRHLRNAFAHGNTYFFDNGNILLEDKDKNKNKNRITARVLLQMQTLLDWIALIDLEQRFYILTDACKNCKSGDADNGSTDC